VMRLGKWAYVVAGVTYKESDCDTLYWDTIEKIPAREAWDENGDKTAALEDAMRDIAHQADSIAERRAEEDREAWVEDRAKQRIEELTDEIATARDHIRTLAREIKAHGAYTPAVCETLQNTIRSQWREIQQWRKEIKKLTAQPYLVLN
jgi:chromosome segregation ATPase